uniref:Saccharopine dehydrogenase NADP binding domain-containing protein n=1 Tax=Cucumis melo subsp. melo TaxID=412675 RepID=E5GBT2_CUCME|nr:hypothetical protein [Cucumis melo subsp. melo]
MAGAFFRLKTLSPMAMANADIQLPLQLPQNVRNSRVLVLGGTGRVGASTAIALSKFCPDLQIVIGGRNREKGEAMVGTLGRNSRFVEVDVGNVDMLEAALSDVDLVVHTAGPFQQTEKCTTAYVDVCDDTKYSQKAKSFKNKAIDANIPAITTAGIYPGVSNVMASELVRAVRDESKGEPERLRFYYYTAGTGGAGPTILATSFLLLGEEVVAYNKGEKLKLKPYSGMLNIDFGKGIGKRDVFLLNLPEVRTAHEILGVPTVSARFGTAPFFWNWGMLALTNLLPLVDLECSNGRNTVGIFSHRRLSQSVGYSTAAFALAVLEGNTQPGVWFPEEPEGIAIEAREVLLSRAAQGTINFVMNKPPWMVETEPKELGLGIYV